MSVPLWSLSSRLVPSKIKSRLGLCFPQDPTAGRECTRDNPEQAPGNENAASCSTKGHACTSGNTCLLAALVLEVWSFAGTDAFSSRLVRIYSLRVKRLMQVATLAPAPAPFASSCVWILAVVTTPRYYLTWMEYLLPRSCPNLAEVCKPLSTSPERPKS